MQLVSDLQQRPKKGRLKIEKNIVMLYDLCSVTQLTVFLIHTVTTMIGASRTFRHYIIVENNFALNEGLVYKTRNCSYNTVRNIYAFQAVNMTFTPSSINDVFVDQAIQMRLAIFVCAVAFLMGALNRMLVEANVFYIKYRNFYFWKDILSATELVLLAYVAQIAAATGPSKQLLRDYLRYCGVQSNTYLPFIGVINLWVFVGVGYFTYVVGLCIYLNNTLPKYGIMTPQEIEEYKVWLRARRAEQEQSRLLIEEAKKAHARLQMMDSAGYRQGDPVPVAPSTMMPSYPMAMMAGRDGVPGGGMPLPPPYHYPYPNPPYPYPPYSSYQGYGSTPPMPPNMINEAGMTMMMPGDPRLPPPQLFGAGMMPMPMPSQNRGEEHPGPGPYALMTPQGPVPYGVTPEHSMGAAPPPMPGANAQLPINMPRRRIVPSPP